MSSIKVWGIDTRTDKLIHINDVTEDIKGFVKCTSPNCDCKLILNKGSKKEPYFRHPANSKCSGGSAESVVHKFVKSVYAERLIAPFKLPAGYFNFKGNTSLLDKEVTTSFGINVNVEKSLQDTKIRPDIWFKTSDGFFNCIEIVFTHGISQETRSKYRDFAKENKLRVYIVNVSHLKEVVNDLTKDMILKETLLILELSTEKFKLEGLAKRGEFKAFAGDIVCPATGTVTNTRNCSKCCFYSGTNGGVVTCYGKECYKGLIDLTSGKTKEERFDMYCELIPSPKEVVKEVFDLEPNVIHPLGKCSLCGGNFTFAKGDRAPAVKGIRTIKYLGNDPIENYDIEAREALYLYCTKCGKYEPIICRHCGKPIKAWKNSSSIYRSCGSVFIGCSNRTQLPEGTCTSDTLTVFTNESCERYADEIKAVGSLENFLSIKGSKKAKEKLDILRGYDSVEKKYKATR